MNFKQFKKYINHYKKRLNFWKKNQWRTLNKNNSNLFISWDYSASKKYVCKRNKFKLFTSKMKFENTFEEIKNISIYYYLVWIFLLISSVYVLFFSDVFYVKTIDVIREDDIVNYNITYNSIDKFRYKSILFVDFREIKDSIISLQPNIKNIKILKIFPNNLKIRIWSYDSSLSFNFKDKNYLITDNWVVIPWENIEETDFIEIKWLENISFLEYKKVFEEEKIMMIKELLTEIKKESNNFWEIKIIYHVKEGELHIQDENESYYIFDLSKNPKVQIEKLNIFLKKYLKDLENKLMYVDLRVNERIIYCDKSEEYHCKQNMKYLYEY